MKNTTPRPESGTLPKRTLLLCALAICASLPLPALASFQCLQNGQTSYQDKPCPPGATERQLADPPPVNATEMARAKQNAAQQKLQLAKLEATQAKQAQLETRQANQDAKKRAATERRCKTLALQTKWAKQDASASNMNHNSNAGKAQAKNQKKAQRSEEKYQLLCGAR